MTDAAIDPIPPGTGSFSWEESFGLRHPPLRVFVALHHSIDQWWPDRFRDRTRCVLEGHVGGHWSQQWDSGGVLLGTVTVFDPPRLIRIAGQLAMSRPAQNVVDFVVDEADGGSTLTIAHRCVGVVDASVRASYEATWRDAVAALSAFLDRS